MINSIRHEEIGGGYTMQCHITLNAADLRPIGGQFEVMALDHNGDELDSATADDEAAALVEFGKLVQKYAGPLQKALDAAELIPGHRYTLALLRQVDQMEHVELDFDGGQIVTNEEINRVQILFDEKPDEATRSKLKSNGFRWSRTEGAWQTQRTPQSLRRACYLLGIDPPKPAPAPTADSDDAQDAAPQDEPDDFSDIDPAAVRAALESGEPSAFVNKVMQDVERIAAAQETAPNGQVLFPFS